jgi:hypothetical protein
MSFFCCCVGSEYTQMEDEKELTVRHFNLKRDSLFIEDHQTIDFNFSDLINYKSGNLNFLHPCDAGCYIVEINNKNESVGVLSISVKPSNKNSKKFKISPMQVKSIFNFKHSSGIATDLPF